MLQFPPAALGGCQIHIWVWSFSRDLCGPAEAMRPSHPESQEKLLQSSLQQVSLSFPSVVALPRPLDLVVLPLLLIHFQSGDHGAGASSIVMWQAGLGEPLTRTNSFQMTCCWGTFQCE